MSKSIKILDIEITEKDFPKLYRWATRNPDGLERTIKSLVENEEKPNYGMIAVNLESDLQHG